MIESRNHSYESHKGFQCDSYRISKVSSLMNAKRLDLRQKFKNSFVKFLIKKFKKYVEVHIFSLGIIRKTSDVIIFFLTNLKMCASSSYCERIRLIAIV